MFSITIETGDVYVHRTAGGGGWGDPLERDPAAVADDVANGKVSIAAARERYGVVVGDERRGRRGRDGRATSGEEKRRDRKADAVVIGAGIMGASTAHFLTRLGFGEVALVEKRKICGGSTQYSAAHVRQHYSNEVGIRLAVRGASMFANAEEDVRRAGRVPSRSATSSSRARGRAGAARHRPGAAELRRRHDVSSSRTRSSSRWPELRLEGVALACHEPTSGFANPVQTVESLVRSAERDGLHVYEGCEVLGDLDRRAGASPASSRATGEIATSVVVNAGGPWGDRIGRMAGDRLPDHVQPRARGRLRRPRGLRRVPRHLGRAAAALLPAVSRRQGARRAGLAEGGGAGRPRDLRRRHRRGAPAARWCRGS